jgi:hypothetical protein
MAKITRFLGNLKAFASAALGTERTIFGDVTQANDLTSQFTADFLRGWGIVGPSDQPTLEDFNAVSYTHGQLLAYLHQAGIAEYNALQEYYIGGLCNVAGVVYRSLVDSNIGNTPASSPTQWSQLYVPSTETVAGISEVASQAEVDAGTAGNFAVTPAKLRFGFGALLAQNGYITFPSWMGGLIIQWSRATIGVSGGYAWSYPTAFTTAVYNCWGTVYAPTAADVVTRSVQPVTPGLTACAFAVSANSAAISAPTGLALLAIGK